ncbi:MAG: glycoside hydrolase family 57 protein [Nanoarchaeota archaeon]
MVSVCFYFQVHQPLRMRKYSVFDIGQNTHYWDDQKNKQIMEKVAKKCYLPMNRLVLDMINKMDGRFKVAYSLSGVFLEQAKEFVPAVVESYEELAKTGCVEFLDETYYHSLSYLYSKEEFKEQVHLHRKMMWELFKQRPRVFRNTELIYSNEIAHFVQGLGYEGIIAEGADHILDWRSPNFVYRPKTAEKMKLLLKNYRLSDDIAFRFSNSSWKDYPLSVEKYAKWINAANGSGEVVNLFMDYETFGEHQWSTTGIFQFMKRLPAEILKHHDNDFLTPSEVIGRYEAKDEIDIHNVISWADVERDLSAWLGNKMQTSAISRLYAMEHAIKNSHDPKLLEDWRKLQISDHFYYMCTKWFADGDVHKYFNPYDSPYDSFIAFMNVVNDLTLRMKKQQSPQGSEAASAIV